MNNFNKTRLVTAIAVAATVVVPNMAAAAGKSHARAAATTTSAAPSALELRLQQMESELSALRAEVARSKSDTRAHVEAVEQKEQAQNAEIDQKIAKVSEEQKHDMLFFRGGYAKMSHARATSTSGGVELLASPSSAAQADDNGDGGWYVGAGFEHLLTNNMWGLWDGASIGGEVMFDYKHLGGSTNTLTAVAVNSAGLVTTSKNQLTMFTLSAAPKVRFNGLGDFSPWIIPFGLTVNVISPPSNGVTVLNPGLMLGTGFDYRVWESLYLGWDFRYQFTGNDLKASASQLGNKGVSTDGLTTGAYLGFGF